MKFIVNRDESEPFPTDDEITASAQSLLGRKDVLIPDGLIEILICDHNAITELNSEFRRENITTDVLAFEMLEEDPEDSQLIIGSIAVNSELAREKATEFCKESGLDSAISIYTYAEVLLYVLHGILHFAGYDDEHPEDRREMFNIANEVLAGMNYNVIPYDLSQEV